ncbi:MAG: ATP-binding protein [bacterium]|nr:ATP-binding protein [bacterium]MCY3926432.1 ATP-binding protein [bacterium]
MSDRESGSQASALLEFRARNVRSFRGDVSLSLESTAVSEPDCVREVPWRMGGTRLSVLAAAGVFGANASGKTNLLGALEDMRMHVVHSFRHGTPGGGVPRSPFLLDERSKAEPSRYEVDLVLNGVLHRYRFSLDDDRVVEESASWYPNGRAVRLFERGLAEVTLGSTHRAKGRAAIGILRPNALFLSAAAQVDHPALLPLYRWFAENLLVIDGESRQSGTMFTAALLDNAVLRDPVIRLMRAADLGITAARMVELDPAMQERVQRVARILGGEEDTQVPGDSVEFEPFGAMRFTHRGRDGEVELDESEESRGTLAWFALLGPILRALADGSVLLVDELDSSLHPTLVRALLELFQEPESNPRHAQIIFNAHDVTVLGDSRSPRLLGRDQIWFTEKSNDGSTRLYPLTDFDPRKQESVGKRFLEGHYGGKPILSLGDFGVAAELAQADK